MGIIIHIEEADWEEMERARNVYWEVLDNIMMLENGEIDEVDFCKFTIEAVEEEY